MRLTRCGAVAAIALSCATLALARDPQPARAFSPIGTACTVAGWFSGIAGKACNAGNKLFGIGKKVFGGGSSSSNKTSKVQAAIGLAAIGAWVMGGAKIAMVETAKVLDHTTSPRLTTTWFSSTYWRMAALAAVLTLPFLFAAAVQALVRSDLALLMRAAFGYLPLALLAVGIAAPLTMLLLSATDEMCRVVSSAAGDAGSRFLARAGALAGAVSILDGSAFLAFLIGLFVAFGALVLWLELLIREAAVYVIVLMLPLAFAAFVWPARRVWATRAVELLVALILSKFAIVAVLSLGGSALGQSPFSGATSMLVGLVLVTLGALAPWAMLRLVPLTEMASGAAASLHGESWRLRRAGALANSTARAALASGGDDGGLADYDDEAEPAYAARSEAERLAELRDPPAPAAKDSAPGRDRPGDRDGSGGRDRLGDRNGSADRDRPESDDGSGDRDHNDVEPADAGERIAGLGPLYQMDDNSWRAIVLGLDDGWPPPSPGPEPGDEPPAAPDPGPNPGPAGGGADPGPPSLQPPQRALPPGSPSSGPHGQAQDGQEAPPVADDHDPRPPGQEPEDGLL